MFLKIKINGTGIFSTHRYKYDKINMPSVIDGLSNQIEVLGNVDDGIEFFGGTVKACLLYTSPSPRDGLLSRMPSSA